MHFKLILVLSTFFLCLDSAFSQDRDCAIPDSIKYLLDTNYANWAIPGPIFTFGGTCGTENKPTNAFEGDFNGDGMMDYAVFIRHTRVLYEGAEPEEIQQMIVFIKDQHNFRLLEVHNGTTARNTYMGFQSKGNKGYIMGDPKDFVYEFESDSLILLFGEKTSISYVYYGGIFVPVTR